MLGWWPPTLSGRVFSASSGVKDGLRPPASPVAFGDHLDKLDTSP
jgi:hypothetical protein